MDRDFLEDYKQREDEEYKRFRKKLLEGNFSIDDRYPPNERFVKIQEPVVRTRAGQIWPQIPLAGSLIVPLIPVQKSEFEELHGFQVSEIPRLVDFAKETGKVQFLLQNSPTEYMELDFLEPILDELRPPWHGGIPSNFFTDKESFKRDRIEFLTLARIKFRDYVWITLPSSTRLTSAFASIMNRYSSIYAILKALGYHGIVDEIMDALVLDPLRAEDILLISDVFLLEPVRNPLKCSDNFDVSSISRIWRFAKAHNLQPSEISFPCEIGKFLMHKLTYYPESLEACKELIAHYQDKDLYRVAGALNEGIRKNGPDVVNKREMELSLIMDDIWQNRTLRRKVTGLKFGIPISLAAIGTVAFGPIGSVGGFLAGLGFSVASKLLNVKAESVGEKLAKALSSNYQANIYDFKKKYHLRD